MRSIILLKGQVVVDLKPKFTIQIGECKMRELKLTKHTFDYENKFRVAGVSGDVSLKSGYNKEDDGILWGLQGGVMVKSHYSQEEKEHRQRMNKMEPLINGEEVMINGKVHIARILGNYSDCVMFDPK